MPKTLEYTCNNDLETRALFETTLKYIGKLAETDSSINKLELQSFSSNVSIDYLAFTNVVANEIVTRLADRQSVLEESSVETRMEKICAYIEGNLEISRAEKRIQNRKTASAGRAKGILSSRADESYFRRTPERTPTNGRNI